MYVLTFHVTTFLLRLFKNFCVILNIIKYVSAKIEDLISCWNSKCKFLWYSTTFFRNTYNTLGFYVSQWLMSVFQDYHFNHLDWSLLKHYVYSKIHTILLFVSQSLILGFQEVIKMILNLIKYFRYLGLQNMIYSTSYYGDSSLGVRASY